MYEPIGLFRAKLKICQFRGHFLQLLLLYKILHVQMTIFIEVWFLFLVLMPPKLP